MPEYLELPAPPALASVVQSFWFLRGDLSGAPVETIVPDGRLEIVLHLGEPFGEVDQAGVTRVQETALVAGQLTAPFRLLPRGYSDVIGIKLRPAGAAGLLRFPIHELAESVVGLRSVRRALVNALLDAVRARGRAEPPNPHERARALALVVGRHWSGEPPAPVRHAVGALGRVAPPRVGALARELGVSERTLERRVVQATGLSPRMLVRVLRFRRAFRLLDGSAPGAWGRVAVQAGYFDQAHLIRDFRAFAGAAPSAFFARDPELCRSVLGAEEPAA